MPLKAGDVYYDIIANDLATPQFEVVNAKVAAMGAKMSSVGRSLTMSVTMPIVGIGVASAKAAADFETTMNKIENMAGQSGAQVAKWSKEIIDLAPSLGRAPRELAEGLYFVTSAGYAGTEAMDILTVSAKAAAIGMGETKDIAGAVTSVLAVYKKTGMTAARATDILASSVKYGKMEAADLAPALGRVLGLAGEMGVSFEELGASVATFTRLGVDADEAVTGLRGILTSVLNPTDEARETFEELGTSIEEVRDRIRNQGLADTMVWLLDLTNGNYDALGKMIPNVRALSAALGTAGAQGDDYKTILQGIKDEHGLVDDAFAKTKETAEQKWNETKASVEASAIKIGGSLTPVADSLKDVADNVADVADAYDKATPAQQKFVNGLIIVGAAAGPLMTIVGNLLKVLANVPLVVAAIFGSLGTWAAKSDSVVAKILAMMFPISGLVYSFMAWEERVKSMTTTLTNFSKSPFFQITSMGVADEYAAGITGWINSTLGLSDSTKKATDSVNGLSLAQQALVMGMSPAELALNRVKAATDAKSAADAAAAQAQTEYNTVIGLYGAESDIAREFADRLTAAEQVAKEKTDALASAKGALAGQVRSATDATNGLITSLNNIPTFKEVTIKINAERYGSGWEQLGVPDEFNPNYPGNAAGGWVSGKQLSWLAEKGPEYVVSNPEVRGLMRGIIPSRLASIMPAGGAGTKFAGMTFNGPITVIANDPAEFMDKMQETAFMTARRM